jgi:hypothetical protein
LQRLAERGHRCDMPATGRPRTTTAACHARGRARSVTRRCVVSRSRGERLAVQSYRDGRDRLAGPARAARSSAVAVLADVTRRRRRRVGIR